jgi:hypothetical protein
MHTNDFITGANTAPAQNAILMIANEEGVIVLVEVLRVDRNVARFLDVELIGILLKQTSTRLLARDAIKRMICEKQVDDVAAHFGQTF